MLFETDTIKTSSADLAINNVCTKALDSTLTGGLNADELTILVFLLTGMTMDMKIQEQPFV